MVAFRIDVLRDGDVVCAEGTYGSLPKFLLKLSSLFVYLKKGLHRLRL